MANSTLTFFDEFKAAIRGSIALLVGNRQAAAYFDFRQTGLIGSFIALVISLAVQAFAPQLLGVPTPPGVSSGVVILGGLVIAVQYGVAFVVLRQLGRSDGFVPFMVVQNWVLLFQAILAVAMMAIFGQPIAVQPGGEMVELTSGMIPFVVLGIASLVVTINIARLVLTLPPLHVALFVIAQLTTALLVQPILGMFL